MQPRDRSIGFESSDPGAPGDQGTAGNSPESIRDVQRRRRDAARMRADMQAILASPDEDEEEEEQPSGPPGAAPARVWVVFRGTSGTDPSGTLRESDSIVGVYATEDAARRVAASINVETAAKAGEGDAWYQPYTVEQ
jgi:transposase InsO family protein